MSARIRKYIFYDGFCDQLHVRYDIFACDKQWSIGLVTADTDHSKFDFEARYYLGARLGRVDFEEVAIQPHNMGSGIFSYIEGPIMPFTFGKVYRRKTHACSEVK